MNVPPYSAPLVVSLLSSAALAQSGAESRFSLVDERTRATTTFSDATLAAQPFQGPLHLSARPLRLVGRSAADQLDPRLPQRVETNGAPAIALPDGGLLVRFVDAPKQESGLLHVSPDGATNVLLALPLVGGADPLLAAIAVSPFERRAALVTNGNATGRGDVWLVRFDGSTFAATGTPARRVTPATPLPDVTPSSLAFARGSLWFVDEDAPLLRAPSDGSADAAIVALPPSGGVPPAIVSGEIGVCADGSTLVFHAGLDEKSWDLYVADAAGTARNLTKAPGVYPSIGLLPDEPRGPFVSLSPDGSRITYAFENPDFDLYTRKSDGSDPAQPLTDDTQFDTSISDGTTVITFASRVFFSMGRTTGTHDFYRAALTPGGVAFANLTATSGSLVTPFDRGSTLTPALAARLGAGEATVVVNDLTATLGRPAFELWSVDAAGSTRLAADLIAAPALASGGPAGAPVTVAILPDAGGTALARVPASTAHPLDVLLRAPAGIRFAALALRADGGEVAFIAEAGGGTSFVAALDLATRRVTRVLTPAQPPIPGLGADQVAYSPSGRLLFTFGPATARFAYAEEPAASGFVRRLTPAAGAPRFLVR